MNKSLTIANNNNNKKEYEGSEALELLITSPDMTAMHPIRDMKQDNMSIVSLTSNDNQSKSNERFSILMKSIMDGKGYNIYEGKGRDHGMHGDNTTKYMSLDGNSHKDLNNNALNQSIHHDINSIQIGSNTYHNTKTTTTKTISSVTATTTVTGMKGYGHDSGAHGRANEQTLSNPSWIEQDPSNNKDDLVNEINNHSDFYVNQTTTIDEDAALKDMRYGYNHDDDHDMMGYHVHSIPISINHGGIPSNIQPLSVDNNNNNNGDDDEMFMDQGDSGDTNKGMGNNKANNINPTTISAFPSPELSTTSMLFQSNPLDAMIMMNINPNSAINNNNNNNISSSPSLQPISITPQPPNGYDVPSFITRDNAFRIDEYKDQPLFSPINLSKSDADGNYNDNEYFFNFNDHAAATAATTTTITSVAVENDTNAMNISKMSHSFDKDEWKDDIYANKLQGLEYYSISPMFIESPTNLSRAKRSRSASMPAPFGMDPATALGVLRNGKDQQVKPKKSSTPKKNGTKQNMMRSPRTTANNNHNNTTSASSSMSSMASPRKKQNQSTTMDGNFVSNGSSNIITVPVIGAGLLGMKSIEHGLKGSEITDRDKKKGFASFNSGSSSSMSIASLSDSLSSSTTDSPTASRMNVENPIKKFNFDNDMDGEDDDNGMEDENDDDDDYDESNKDGRKSLSNHSKLSSSDMSSSSLTGQKSNRKVKKTKSTVGRDVKITSVFRGVSCCGKDRKWQARIRDLNRVAYLGRYVSEFDAAIAYDNAVRERRGNTAPTNFVEMDAETIALVKEAFDSNGGKLPKEFLKYMSPDTLGLKKVAA